MSAMPRWQSNSHTALPLDGLPSEYRFATAPPVVDGARPWKDDGPGVLRPQLSNDERMAATIQRKYGDVDDTVPWPPRKTSNDDRAPGSRDRALTTHDRAPAYFDRPPASYDRVLTNEERYLKSTVDERVARALYERKASNEERPSKAERRVPPRLELSRLFTRRKSSKTSNATSTPSSVVSDSFEPAATQPTPVTATYRTLRKSRSRDSPVDPAPRSSEHEYTKIHVRKPPPGIQHWFDGLDDYASTKGHSRQTSEEAPAAAAAVAAAASRARDTFLSISTGPPREGQEPGKQSPRKPLHGVGIPRSPPPSAPPSLRQSLRRSRTTPGLRPESLHSQYSAATVQASSSSVVSPPAEKADKSERPDSRHSPAKRHALPDSIQESVLILSETDESDFDDQDDTDVPPEAKAQMQASILDAAVADVVTTPKAPVTIRNLKHSMNKPLPPIRVSQTTHIEDKSQVPYDDGYSSRTSLLSDLRPLSFHSHHTESTIEESDGVLPSPTTSMNLPERAMQEYFSSSSPYSEDTRPSSSRRWNSSGPTHKLMAVTPEEANLLSAMRKKRAQMQASAAAAARPLTAPTHLRSKSHAAGAEVPRRRAHMEGLSLQTDLSDEPSFDSGDGEPSPRDTRVRPLAQRGPRSADAVSQVWADVQDWRRRQAASRDSTLIPAALQSRFSPDTEALARPVVPHSQSDGKDVRRSRTSGSSAARSKSMGRTSGNTDVEQDVLAAWNELGGWRRSAGEAAAAAAAAAASKTSSSSAARRS